MLSIQKRILEYKRRNKLNDSQLAAKLGYKTSSIPCVLHGKLGKQALKRLTTSFDSVPILDSYIGQAGEGLIATKNIAPSVPVAKSKKDVRNTGFFKVVSGPEDYPVSNNPALETCEITVGSVTFVLTGIDLHVRANQVPGSSYSYSIKMDDGKSTD